MNLLDVLEAYLVKSQLINTLKKHDVPNYIGISISIFKF